jgi:hypothetical protein
MGEGRAPETVFGVGRSSVRVTQFGQLAADTGQNLEGNGRRRLELELDRNEQLLLVDVS